MNKKLLFALFFVPLMLLPVNIWAMSFEFTDILKHMDKSRQVIEIDRINSFESLASDINDNLYAGTDYLIDNKTAHKNGNSGSNAMALSFSDSDYNIGIGFPDELCFLEIYNGVIPKRIGDSFNDDKNPGAPVPEPATILLFGFGMIGLAVTGRKTFLKSESSTG